MKFLPTCFVRFLIAIAASLTWQGCSSDALPPADPPPLQAESLEEVSLTIDGRDPLQEELVFKSGTSHLISASYIRYGKADADWYSVSLLLVEDDPGENVEKVRMNRMLGLPENEQELRGKKKRIWNSRPTEGLEGRKMAFPSNPGRYELRLCWMRRPKTVAEKVSQSKNPLLFTTPFYRAYITIQAEP